MEERTLIDLLGLEPAKTSATSNAFLKFAEEHGAFVTSFTRAPEFGFFQLTVRGLDWTIDVKGDSFDGVCRAAKEAIEARRSGKAGGAEPSVSARPEPVAERGGDVGSNGPGDVLPGLHDAAPKRKGVGGKVVPPAIRRNYKRPPSGG